MFAFADYTDCNLSSESFDALANFTTAVKSVKFLDNNETIILRAKDIYTPTINITIMIIKRFIWVPLLIVLTVASFELSNVVSSGDFESLAEILKSPFKPTFTFASEDYYVESENIDELREDLYLMINVIRMNNGVSKLKKDEKLELAAQKHAEDMIKRHYLSHYTPEGKSVFDRLKDVGYNYYVAGENIFEANRLQYLDPMNMSKVVIDGWMNSKMHRENLLNPAYEEIGIGIGYDPEKKRLVVVADFGSELK